jgi:flagellar basal body-associated protein FliL
MESAAFEVFRPRGKITSILILIVIVILAIAALITSSIVIIDGDGVGKNITHHGQTVDRRSIQYVLNASAISGCRL